MSEKRSAVAPRGTTRRVEILDQLMLEARRSGSVGTLHNRAAADLAGMGSTDWACLDVLDWTGPITAGELARRIGITSGAVTGVADRLSRLGLVRRADDPTDRRKKIIELDRPPVDSALSACFAALAAEMDEVNDRFDADQLGAIAEWLLLSNEALERSIERMRAAKRDV